MLSETAHGVRVAGDPDQLVETVGLCGGAGDFLLDRARALGVDVYLTSDLRHHPASELREHGAPALVDVAHWAAESHLAAGAPWSAARRAGRYGGGHASARRTPTRGPSGPEIHNYIRRIL